MVDLKAVTSKVKSAVGLKAAGLKPVRIAQTIERGIVPTLRHPGLRDPINPKEKGADRLCPKYLLVVNKITLPAEITKHIVDVEYEDNEELFDQLKITLKGYFNDTRTNKLIPIPEWVQSSTIFSEGNIMWVFGGYGAYLKLIGGVEIVKREFQYTSDPQCVITGYEPLHRMANTFAENAIKYSGMRSSSIVKKIAMKSEYVGSIGALFDTSLIGDLPIFKKEAEVQKRGESDYAFLKRMADVRGWQLYTKFDTANNKFKLYYGPDVDRQDGIFRYVYNPKSNVYPEDTILSFIPTISVIDQHTEINITSVDEKRKGKIQSTQKYIPYADGKSPVNRKFSGNNTDFKQGELQNPTTYRFQAFGMSRKVVANRPFKSEEEVKKFIINWARENIKNFITGEGKVSGNEDMQSRQAHYFMGLGETFSGTETHPARWYLTKVVHKFSGGSDLVYETSFSMRKVVDYLPNDDIRANVPATISDKEAKYKKVRLETIKYKVAK